MSDFITNGSSELPDVKSDARPSTGLTTEWAAADANKIRQALLDTRGAVMSLEQIATSGLNLNNPSAASILSTGSTTPRTLAARFAEVVNVKDFGAVGDGVADDTAAIQSVLNLLTGSTSATEQPMIFFPPGTYLISSTLSPPNSASYYTICGSNPGTVIKWGGSAGSPMLLLTNARSVTIRDIAFYGAIGSRPNYVLQFHRAAGAVGAGAPLGCRVTNVRIGSSGSDHDVGIGYTCDVGQDANNEQGYFESVEINNSNTYAYSFEHSNSLLHKIVGGHCAGYLGAAVNNYVASASYGGSFSVFGTNFGAGAAAAVTFNLMHPRHSIAIVDAHVEGQEKFFIKTNGTWNSTYQSISVLGGQFALSDAGVGEYNIDINARHASVLFAGCDMAAPTGLKYRFRGVYAKVLMANCAISINDISYGDCSVTLKDVYNDSGGPTYTNLGSGTLRLENSAFNAFRQVSSGTTLSASGTQDNVISLTHGSPTTITTMTDGYVGQRFTLFSGTTNVTLAHASGADGFYLSGGVNYTMGYFATITFVRSSAAFGNYWIEVSRKA